LALIQQGESEESATEIAVNAATGGEAPRFAQAEWGFGGLKGLKGLAGKAAGFAGKAGGGIMGGLKTAGGFLAKHKKALAIGGLAVGGLAVGGALLLRKKRLAGQKAASASAAKIKGKKHHGGGGHKHKHKHGRKGHKHGKGKKYGSGQLPYQRKRMPEDVEDCVACRYVWLQVEMDVGNSQIEENIYDSFYQNCLEGQKSPIFYPACQTMFDSVDDMIGDYMDGYTINQMCENSLLCR